MDKGLIYRNTVFNVKTARRNPESNTKGFFALIKIEKKKKKTFLIIGKIIKYRRILRNHIHIANSNTA